MGFQVLGDTGTLTRLLVLLTFVAALSMITTLLVIAAGAAHGVGPLLTSAAVRWSGGALAVVALGARGRTLWRRRSGRTGPPALDDGREGAGSRDVATDDG